MKTIKLIALSLFAVAALGLGACSSKPQATHTPEQPVTYGYSK